MEINQWLETKLQQDIWEKKYRFENETLDNFFERVSGGNQIIKQLIIDKKFLFGGRILANRGLTKSGKKVTYSNCYVITPPEDNIESIFDCAKKLARTYSYGGGCGIDISKLSPKGSKINNAAKETTGAVSFMELYNLTTQLIGQQGRRGALMISIDCSHPDLIEFINIKSDLNQMNKANLSIRINDDFMNAVENNLDWNLHFERNETGEKIEKIVKAKEIFHLMAKMNWDYAEPGELNWGHISRWNLLNEDRNFEYGGVNPCFTGDMKLLTTEGYKTFSELENKNINIINMNGDISNSKVWCSGEKDVIVLALSDDKTINCTPDHIFMLNDGTECKAENLIGKQLKHYNNCEIFVEDIVDKFKAKVYDFSEPITHWGVVEGVIVHNCAEEPLPPGGSCLLGSINLSEFIINPFTDNRKFDFVNFNETVRQGVIALNEVLHEGLKLHPLEEQIESVNNWRQIGLGLFGWHDALIKLGIRYGSQESLNLADAIGFNMINTTIAYSSETTDIYGKYPMYNEEAIFKSEFFIKNTDEFTKELVKSKGLANSQLLTVPPTGSIGTMLGVSTALEPIFEIAYTRKTESLHGKDEYYKVYTPIVEKYMKVNDIKNENDLPDFINTSTSINYKERIAMQSRWQKYIDASISSTINVSNNFTIEEVEDLYMQAWKQGLKGVTIYREGCKKEAILSNNTNKEKIYEYEELPRGFIESVPEGLSYRKYKLKTGCGNLYFFVGVDEEDCKIYDCFTNTDGVGGCTINTQANSRLLSAALRGGVPVEYLIDQLNKAGVCPSFQYKKGKGEKLCKGKSCSSAIGNVLKDILKEFEDDEDIENNEEKLKGDIKINKNLDSLCPECKEPLIHEGSCASCRNCGWSRCS